MLQRVERFMPATNDETIDDSAHVDSIYFKLTINFGEKDTLRSSSFILYEPRLRK